MDLFIKIYNFMEQEMKKDWLVIKGVIQKFSEKTRNRPYLTDEQMKEFERKMNNALREKKLKRILKKCQK